MRKPTENAINRALALHLEGKTNKEITETAPEGERLSHSQLEIAIVHLHIAPTAAARACTREACPWYGPKLAQPESLTVKAAQVAKLRTEGQSWGVIACRYNEPETRTRRDFEEATGTRSKGMRIGKGGRWVQNDQRFYTGADRAKLGKELTRSAPISEQVPADPNQPEERKLPELAGAATPKPAPRKRAPKK